MPGRILTRRDALRVGGAALAASALPGLAVADTRPRKVSAPRREPLMADGRPPRLVLGDGHLILALALILDDPASVIAGWQGDFVRHSNTLFEDWAGRAPALRDVPVLGTALPETFSQETALGLAPDALVLGGCYGPGPENTRLVERFEAAGIPVVAVDFYDDPLRNTAPSLRTLGALFGGRAAERAEVFARRHETRQAAIAKRAAGLARPRVLLQANAQAPGWACCWMPGGAGLGKFIETAGGHNLGTSLAPSRPWVKAAPEWTLAAEPDLFVTTGGPYLADGAGLHIGPGVAEAEARQSLAASLQGGPLAVLPALRQGRAHGLWHLFQATPLNILALEALAAWLHPKIFGDDSDRLTQAELNRDVLAWPIDGCLSVSL